MTYHMPIGGVRSALLAVAGVRAVVDGNLVLSGLVGVGSLLGGHSNAAILGSLDTDSLDVGFELEYHSRRLCCESIDMVCTLVLAKPEY
jgi:hypothetical protein